MALYSTCQYRIHNTEPSLGYCTSMLVYLASACYSIMLVHHIMTCCFISYMLHILRPDDLGKDIGSSCLRACPSVLLVHPKGGRPGDARVVTSCTSVVFGYAGSFGYDRAPRCDWGRWQVVTALSVRRNSSVAFSVLPDVTELDVLRCGTFSPLSHFPGTCNPNHDLT